MTIFLLNVLLAVAWSALNGNFSPIDLLVGFLISYVILWTIYRKNPQATYFRRGLTILEFLIFFIKELFVANIRVAITVLSPKMNLKPAVIAIPIDLKSDGAITLLTNLITLTPGSLSLDVSTDKSTLYVHALWVQDPESFRENIKSGYERRVKELFG